MKIKYLIILAFIISNYMVSAQTDSLERSICNGIDHEYACAIAETEGTSYYIAYRTTDYDNFYLQPYIIKLNEKGQTQWSHRPIYYYPNPPIFLETPGAGQIIFDYDSNIVCSGIMTGCDVAQGLGYAEKLSRVNGSIIWQKTFDLTNYFFGQGLAQSSDSGFLITSDSMLYRLNSAGDSISFYNYSLGRIYYIIPTHDNSYLLNCHYGIIKIDTAGNVLYTLPIPTSILFNLVNYHVTATDSNFYFFSKDTIIYKTDSALNIVNQISIGDTASYINTIVAKDNMLWVILHRKTGNISSLLNIDYNLNILSLHDYSNFNGDDLDVNDLLVHTGKYDLISYERLGKGGVLLLKSWEKGTNNSYSYNSDIGVSALQIDSVYADLWNSPIDTVVFPHIKFKALIKNYGQYPVDSFYVNGMAPGAYTTICLPPSYSVSFLQPLQPGDSTWVDLGFVLGQVYSTASIPSNTISHCFYTSSPNALMDYNHSNDNACITFTVDNFVGINEINPALDFSISPNPVNDVLIVSINSFVAKDYQLEILNTFGQKLTEKKVNASATTYQTTLNLESLRSGVYFIKVNNRVQRFVKL